jgi:Polyketide cyclase / dehydrase and lipid transport
VIIARLSTVRVTDSLDGSVHEAETCWYDLARWPEWVDGLARVVAVDGDWPRPGARVIWESGPAGRGRVTERVTEYEPLARHTVDVEDDSIRGTQRVEFEPAANGVRIQLTLSYSIKRRSPLTPLVDLLFVRRPMATSLTKTLERFGLTLADSREPSVG